MKKITKLELVMTLIALISCGIIYGIWRIQTSEDNLTPSTSVLKVEEKQQVEKPVEKEGFVAEGRIPVIFNK
jgi:hypothetical protein